MFDLSTDVSNDNKLSLYGVYIDYDGNIKSFDFDVIEASIHTNLDQLSVWKEVFASYSNKLLNLRGFSTFEKLNSFTLDVPNLKIKSSTDIINYLDTFSPCNGSLKECLELSIQHEACNIIFSSGGGYSDAKVKLDYKINSGDNFNQLNLITFNDNGFDLKRGKIIHEFYDDRNPTCATCIEGYNKYISIINKLNNYVIANTKLAVFDGDFINDMDVTDEKTIVDSIKGNFHSVLELAKIKNIRYEYIGAM